jgi:hypothetical protein
VEYSFRFSDGGSIVESSPIDRPKVPQVGGGIRSTVTSFSGASRLRLIKRLSAIQRESLEHALFITLTYPNNEQEGKKAKRDLMTFLKRVDRAYPSAAGTWRLEFQERGAIHFHLLLWGLEFIPFKWVADNWYQVVGSDNPDHLAAGTSIERVHSHRKAVSYVAKYMSKEEQARQVGDGIGRFWGMFGDWEKALAPIVEWIVDEKGMSRLWRVFDNLRLAAARKQEWEKVRSGQIERARKRRSHILYSGFLLCNPSAILPQVAAIITQ